MEKKIDPYTIPITFLEKEKEEKNEVPMELETYFYARECISVINYIKGIIDNYEIDDDAKVKCISVIIENLK